MSIKLSDTQLVMLSAAAQRDDRCLTLSGKLKGAAAHKVATKLIAAGLVEEVKAKAGMPVWRRDEQDGQSYALRLTAAGAKAIAVNPDDDASPSGDEERSPPGVDQPPTSTELDRTAAEASTAESAQAFATPRAPRLGTKLATAIEMLRATEGATVAELSQAMGWLPHTTRAVLTGLRTRGYALTLDRSDAERGSAYRIVRDATAAQEGTALTATEPPISEPIDGASDSLRLSPTVIRDAASLRRDQDAASGVMARRRSTGHNAGKGLPLPALWPVEEAEGGLLRRRWRSIMGRHAPKTLSPTLMARILAWREQVVEVGDVSSRSRVILAAAIRGTGQRAEAGGEPEAGPIAKSSPRFEPIRRGTVLVREHAGVVHRVTVAGDGFVWNGRIFGSLSGVARAITGVHWSGRRFFGLDRGLREGGDRKSQGRPNPTSDATGPS